MAPVLTKFVRSRARWSALGLAGVLTLAGCGGPRARVMAAVDTGEVDRSLAAYERFRGEEGADPRLLGFVAEIVLEEEATGEDHRRRDAALTQLAMAGTRGEVVLRRLLDLPLASVVGARAAVTLAARGDGGAVDRLTPLLTAQDAELFACGLVALDVEREWPTLVVAAAHHSPLVRQSALEMLARAEPRASVGRVLAEVARTDPEARVRAAAVRALGHQGDSGFESLRERLSDADAGVRMAAVAALVAANSDRAVAVLGPLLSLPPEAAAVEAARQLALATRDREGERGATDARAYLLGALRAGPAAVRTQAAVAIASLGDDSTLDSALGLALAAETEPVVRLSLAGTLMRRPAHADAARAALVALLETEPAVMTSIQAAALLAQHGDRQAVQRLVAWLRHPSPAERRVAARALARDALEPDAARLALRDGDAYVRIAAAGGILAAIPALSSR